MKIKHLTKNESFFWKKKSKNLYWFKAPKTIFSSKKNFKNIWYEDGVINASYNCLDLNIENGLGNKVAIHSIDKNGNINNLTYYQLLHAVQNFCLYLKQNFKISKSTRVMIHSSACLESAICMLSCSRLGILFNVIFEDLERVAIEKRMEIFKPHLIISNTNKAKLKKDILPIIKSYQLKKNNFLGGIVFNYRSNRNNNIFSTSLDKISAIKNTGNLSIKAKKIKSNNKLFVLFTSGSTGEPKGVIHSTGGYLTYVYYTCENKFGLNKDSVILTASDAGWINGHSYALFGPLLFGATTILLEKPASILSNFIINKIIYDLNTTILYLPVTLIRMLKSINIDNRPFNNHSIKTLGSMGESLAEDIAMWYSNFFSQKNKSIINTYFQTETGGIVASPSYKENIYDSPHGTVGKAIEGVKIKIDNINKKNKNKEIVITSLWPGCMTETLGSKNIWNTYWTSKGFFRLFDDAKFDSKKNIIIKGRTDDVMNIRGHRIGSAEIESIILKIDYVVEVCAIGVKDSLEGSVLFLLLVLNNFDNKIEDDIKKNIINYFGSFALPKKILVVNELPKTKSGKILRRLIRNVLDNKKIDKNFEMSTIYNKKSIYDILYKIK